jgi:DNA-binding XRE family transcriptional regulator
VTAATRKKAASPRRGKKQAGGRPAWADGPGPEPPPVPEWRLARERPKLLEGFAVGDSVRVDREPGATFKVTGFVVPVHEDDPALANGPWAELFGGPSGMGQHRCVFVGRLRGTKRVHETHRRSDKDAEAAEARRTAPRGDKEWGGKLRDLRKAAGLTQAQLAERAGLHHGLIPRLEGGSRGVTDAELEALAAALDGLR